MNASIAAGQPLLVTEQRPASSGSTRAPLRRYRISRLRFDARVAGRVVEARDTKRVDG